MAAAGLTCPSTLGRLLLQGEHEAVLGLLRVERNQGSEDGLGVLELLSVPHLHRLKVLRTHADHLPKGDARHWPSALDVYRFHFPLLSNLFSFFLFRLNLKINL